MSIEETIRQVVREEVRAAVRELADAFRERSTGSPDDRLTLAEAAAEARRSSATVKRWTETGQLRCSRRGKTILILRADLDEFLRADAIPDSDAEIDQMAKAIVHGKR